VSTVGRDAPSRAGGPLRADATRSGRTLRADAARNRDRLLAVGAEMFAQRGAEVPLEDIARQAGVGIGTLYRHFPTRDVLVEAIYRRNVEQICDRIPQLLAEQTPGQALATWLPEFVEYVARKRGMAAALKSVVGADSELFAYTHRRINEAITLLLRSAADAGAIRADVEAPDLLRLLSGICMAAGDSAAQEQSRRLVALVLDGLRYGATRAG
jgi:AcrR family transcriptional regulator